jgi:Flp pilus assembly pilin Flp
LHNNLYGKEEQIMLQKLRDFPLAGYLSLKGLARDLKEDERGLEVVQVVLIILVGVLLVVALWGVLSGWLGDLWNRITGAGDTIQPIDF